MSERDWSHIFEESELKSVPIEQAHTLPSKWYHQTEYFDFEMHHLFQYAWQYVCHTDQLKEPGSSYSAKVAGHPVIVFKDSKDQLRAFYNVCKHRGGPLAIKRGTKTVLQCQYHGWTYLDDGSLRGVPDWNLVELFDKKDFGLDPIEISVWQGLIFARAVSTEITLNSLMDGISERIHPMDLNRLSFHQEQVYEIECNWKVYVDNYLEGYHIPIVHPELANLLDYRAYVTECHTWHSLQHSPFQGTENIYAAEGGEAFYYFIYPNMMLNILPGRLQVNLVVPVSPTRSKVLFSYFYENTPEHVIAEDISYSHQIQMEDVEICEAVQAGLQSRAYDQGRFSVKREQGVYHFQQMLKQQIKNALNRQ